MRNRNIIRVGIIVSLFLLTIACTVTTTTTSNNTTETTVTTMDTTTTTTQVNLIDKIELITETPMVGELLELAVYEPENNLKISTLYNPYDYSQISVDVIFNTPSGSNLKQSAFWYKQYRDLTLIGEVIDEDGFYTAGQELVRWLDNGFSHYMVRINPTEAGNWTYVMNLTVEGAIVQSMQGSFTVAEPTQTDDGYIRVDQVNKKTFVFDSGEGYTPIGLNLAWWSTTLSSHDYANWFKHMNENNANYARIWLSNWSFSLHKDSYTNFDTRQSTAIRLDHLFETAKEHDVYIMLTLINHGQFSANTNPEWSENVYNEKNGGMLEYPIQFFYNAEAKAAYKNELRYIISRYGYSQNIFAWELFNEVDWVDGYSTIAVTNWHNEMAKFLHDNDPYNHLVTTSYKYTFGTAAYALDSIDFVAVHSYAYNDVKFYEKLVGEQTSLWNNYQKPVLFGEIGIDWQSGTSTYHTDFTGVTIKQGAWGGMMSGAGSANHWWWDSWIAKYDMWYRFKGAGVYAEYLDLTGKTFTALQSSGIQISDTNVKAMGYLLEDSIYGYIYNNNWNYWNRLPATIQNVNIAIGMANGEYQLLIFNTDTGEIVSDTLVTISNQSFVLSGLSITEDYAFILRK
jgi:hypothetical protein